MRIVGIRIRANEGESKSDLIGERSCRAKRHGAVFVFGALLDSLEATLETVLGRSRGGSVGAVLETAPETALKAALEAVLSLFCRGGPRGGPRDGKGPSRTGLTKAPRRSPYDGLETALGPSSRRP